MRYLLLGLVLFIGGQLALPTTAGADDLLDAARKAKARRKAKAKASGTSERVTDGAVLTNREIRTSGSGGNLVTTGKASGESSDDGSAEKGDATEETEATEDAAPADGAETAEDAPKDEAYWRERLAEAQAAVTAARQKVADTNTAINELRRGATAMDDPNVQLRQRQELLTKQSELEGAQQAVKNAESGVTKLREEARRARVPAGWLR